MTNKEYSPFSPGNLVPVELFVGRSPQLEEALKYINQASFGKHENVFLEGERGIGKSSLASFLRYWVISKKAFLGIHVFLGGVSTLEEMVRRIFDQVLKECNYQPWFKRISQFFGDHIQQFGLFGISVGFRPPQTQLEQLVRQFPDALNNLVGKIKPEKKGLFIALDDINGLADKKEFANWYKSCVDEIATHYKEFPVFIMPIGLPERRDALSSLQPSLMRVFRVVQIEKLIDDEVKSFLSKAFDKAGRKVKAKAMDLMVKYSSGLPILMHEIGDATFWGDEDGTISEEDAISGILAAAEVIGRKYLDPKLYRTVRSERYRSILRKFADLPVSRYFTKSHVEASLNEKEKKVFHNFLRKLRELVIIEADLERGRGAYRFVNELYPVYLNMEAKLHKSKR